MARFKIQNDKDLQYVLRVGNGDSEVYVIVEHHLQQHVNQSVKAQPLLELNHQSFVQLMASQFAFANGSNYMHVSDPFFELQGLIEITYGQQLMNKTTFFSNDALPFENDEIQNSFDEVEDGRAILKYDLVLLDNTDSDEIEPYSTNKNNENTKPTNYDSAPDFGIGYISINEYVDYHVDECRRVFVRSGTIPMLDRVITNYVVRCDWALENLNLFNKS